MEPNVDRMQWSVVALLAAIVIGGVVLLAFPRISGKIANSMDDSVDGAFNGKVPSWVNGNKDSEDEGENEGDETNNNSESFLNEKIYKDKTRGDFFEDLGVKPFDPKEKQKGIKFITMPANEYGSDFSEQDLVIVGVEMDEGFQVDTLIIPDELEGKKIVGVGAKNRENRKAVKNSGGSYKNIYLGDNVKEVYPIKGSFTEGFDINDGIIISGKNLKVIRENAFDKTNAADFVPSAKLTRIESDSFENTKVREFHAPDNMEVFAEDAPNARGDVKISVNVANPAKLKIIRRGVYSNVKYNLAYDTYQEKFSVDKSYGKFGVDKIYKGNNPEYVKFVMDDQNRVEVQIAKGYRAHTLYIPSHIDGKAISTIKAYTSFDYVSGEKVSKYPEFTTIYVDAEKTFFDGMLNGKRLDGIFGPNLGATNLVIGDNVKELPSRSFDGVGVKNVVLGKNVKVIGREGLAIRQEYWEQMHFNDTTELHELRENAFGKYTKGSTKLVLPDSVQRISTTPVDRGPDFTVEVRANATISFPGPEGSPLFPIYVKR